MQGGGPIWITAGTITGSGVLTADGGSGAQGAQSGGGGRIAVYCDDTSGFSGRMACTANGGVEAEYPGQDGTVGFFDSVGSHLTVYHHYIVEPERTVSLDSLTLENAATLLLGGGSTLTLSGDLALNDSSTLQVQGLHTDWTRKVRCRRRTGCSADPHAYTPHCR